jgi:para-nitrobenzyl esterase
MPTVTTSHGQLRGTLEDGLHVFRGIPFAAPPVGPLRFRPPQPVSAWDGVRDAVAFGPAAMQVESPMSKALAMEFDSCAEDCLYLNVWTPSLEGQRPVMVWIHGGAFVIGTGSQALYNGEHLARRGDVVIVTLNYRLGAFGFLHGKAAARGLESTGNEAILDQVAALRWVRDEIVAFGGDPGNVTVFGESAGSASIAALLGTPAAKGLFQRAIMQSGSANLLTTPVAASEVTGALLQHFDLTPETAGGLREVPAEALLAAQDGATPRTNAGVNYAPVVDGEVIPRSPFDAVASGAMKGVPILAGTNLDEMKLFAFMDPGVFQLTEAGLADRVEALAPGAAEELIAAYRTARAARGESVTPFETYEAIMTDHAMRLPTARMLELQSRHAPTYAYLFTHRSPSLGGMLGACHALDLPFVFGTQRLDAMRTFAGTGEGVDALAERMQDAWLAFAKTGNPSHEGLPAWPRFEPGRRSTMLLGPECRVEDAPGEAERLSWPEAAAARAGSGGAVFPAGEHAHPIARLLRWVRSRLRRPG